MMTHENTDENKNMEKISIYQEQFNSALDDYTKSYISTQLFPSVQEYSNTFANDKGILTALNKDLFVLKNNIELKTNEINNSINVLNEKIKREKSLNKTLTYRYQQINGSGEGASLMIDNATELYKKQYISNWDMILGIVIVCWFMYKYFRGGSGSSGSSSISTAPVNPTTYANAEKL